MGLFHRRDKQGFYRDFSDTDIDGFVAYLKERNMTMSAEDVQAALHSQSNDDPRRLREKKLPKAIILNENSALFRLWETWEKRPESATFEPLELMGERIEEAHEIYLKNRAALMSGAAAGYGGGADHATDTAEPVQSVAERRAEAEQKNKILEDLDDNQKEILNFESELERTADKTFNRILRERAAASTKEINNLTQQMQQMNQSPKLVDGDIANLRALGGFSSKEEAEQALAEFRDKVSAEPTEEEEVVDVEPVDATIFLRLTENKIRAWLFLLPPRNGGADVTEEEIRDCLEINNIRYGVDTYLIHKIVEQKLYFKLLQIATGIDAMHGRNGQVEELIRRDRSVSLQEDEHGNVDYKELNIIASVHAGEAICHVALPTKAQDGRTVTDEPVKGKDGRYPTVPQGKNTQLNEDGSKLLATIDGEVVFESGLFRVQRLLTIPGDVDNSTGNIDFAGDVVVNGDVRDGFSVHAGGRLYIRGTAEGAKVSADGDVNIERGMVGGQKGSISSGGVVRCKYLENCRVYAKGKIYVENIVFSDVSSDDTVVITNERGTISGGKITAGRMVSAKTIGSRNNSGLTTKIVLGATPQMLEQQQTLQTKQETIEANIKKLQQNITYIENGPPSAREARKPMLDQLRIQLQMRQLQKAQADRQLANLTGELFNNTSKCQLVCDSIFPLVIVTIGEETVTIRDEKRYCKIAMQNGAVVVDTM